MSITTRSGRMLLAPSMGKSVDGELVVDESEECNPVESEKLDSSADASDKEIENEEEVTLKTIPRPPPPFPKRLNKKVEDAKISKFMAMLNQLMVNVPLTEALEQIPGYKKFMKNLVTTKWKVSYVPEDSLLHYGPISTRSLQQKNADPRAFTILCTIGSLKFTKPLCDLGSSINLMPLSMYNKLGLEDHTATNMRLGIVDRFVKRPVGILHDVLVKESGFILPGDFMVLDCEVDEVPIILGSPLLTTRRVLLDIEFNKLKLRFNEKEEPNVPKIIGVDDDISAQNTHNPIRYDENQQGLGLDRGAEEVADPPITNTGATPYVEVKDSEVLQPTSSVQEVLGSSE
ncbi:uncharacterized protein LOC124899476 [Capsicum annuum]|uniref:uncharacterized protein LOC124899476 n=1 Tax=Capsicum annuum TaxID=4072 RepID=UPI001FB18129|nr:uncharacterized protein LOC124899476 [Capsicum annuum]